MAQQRQTVSFRDLVLTDAQLSGAEEAPPIPGELVDPQRYWPEYEVVAASFSDSCLIHRMDDHDDLIVLLMSKGQFYVRDADGLEPPRRLSAEELARQLSSLAPSGAGVDVVPWSTPLLPGPRLARGFVSLASDPTFQRLAKSSQVIAEYGAAADWMDGAPMRDIVSTRGKGFVRAIVEPVTRHAGDRGAAAALGMALNLWNPWSREADVASLVGCNLTRFRDALDVFSHPRAFATVADTFGLDCARSYLAGYLDLPNRDTWALEQASLEDFVGLVKRLGISMKPSAFVSYAIDQRRAQGANVYDGSHWLDLWGDTLAMEDLVHGTIDDKYPTDLIAMHDQLIREASRVRHAIVDTGPAADAMGVDPFEEHRLALEANAHEDGRYLIRPPRDVQEMLAEARDQRNCLASYVSAFEHADTDIYLMRRVDAPSVPCVTVEVRGGRVRQAFRGSNRQMTGDQRAWLDAWCDSHGIGRLATSEALCVDLAYAEAPRRVPVDPMAAANAADIRGNRPSTWRR